MNKISSEIELSASNSSGKDRPALVPTPYIPISSIQNNSSTHFSLSFLSYKSTSLLPTLRFKKSTIEIKENSNVDFDV